MSGHSHPSSNAANIPEADLIRTLVRLREDRRIIPLGELLTRTAKGRALDGLAAITFDDAYASLAELLGPWLRSEQIPYSIFVTTDVSRFGKRFWWDRIEDIHPKVDTAHWRRFEDALGLPEAYRIGQPAELGPLRPLRQFILSRFQGRWPASFEEPLLSLEDVGGGATIQRAMTFDEIDALTSWGGVEVGVHTCTHPVLSLLSDADIGSEVKNSLEELRERFAASIPVLAIPFGLFDARVLRIASECGATASLTLSNRLFREPNRAPGHPRLSMMRGTPLWRRRIQWLGIAETARRLRRLGRDADPYPPPPSATT